MAANGGTVGDLMMKKEGEGKESGGGEGLVVHGDNTGISQRGGQGTPAKFDGSHNKWKVEGELERSWISVGFTCQ